MPAAPSEFATAAFGAALNVEAIFFGVFGFLYSVYAMYSSLATPENPARAPICKVLKNLCRVMAGLLIANAVVFAYSLYLIGPRGYSEIFLTVGLVVSILTMVFISTLMSFLYME